MSWLYSRALVVEFLEDNSSDGAPFAPSRSTPMPRAYLSPDRMTAFSRPSRFGMTFEPLTVTHGEALSTWYREVFLAKTSAPPARVQALPASDPVSGPRCLGSFAKFDRDTFSWRTHQYSLAGDLTPFSATWPRWGSMRNGECWELRTWERRTSGTASGYWPTPKANDAEKRGNFDTSNPRNGLPAAVRKWPTPTSSLGTKGGRVTPRKTREGGTLIEAVLARTVATMAKNSRPLSEQIGGQLNPTWVEWLMGWPLGWTAFEPLEMVKCRNAPLKHGDCCTAERGNRR